MDPRDGAVTETLKNGLRVTVRALREDDRERVARAVQGLDRETVYFRLFSHREELTEAGLDRIMRLDPAHELAMLVVTEDGRAIGSGRYVVSRPGVAEVAFVVEEDFHGQGIASRLIRHLARAAKAQGIVEFEADTLADNKAMRAVFERTGWPMTVTREGSIVHVALALPDAF